MTKGKQMTRHALFNIFLAGLCVSFLGFCLLARKERISREQAITTQPDTALVRDYCRMMDKWWKIKKEYRDGKE